MSESTGRSVLHSEGPEDAVSDGEWARIAEGCRRKDHRCFEQLVARTEGRLRRILTRLVDRSDDVDELLQETYLRAWRGIGGFRGRSGLATWLTRIALNVALNWRRNRRPTVPLPSQHPLPCAASVPDESLVAAYEQALAELAPELRSVFVLHETEAMTYQQIADLLECPIGTVMSRLHRARAQLMSELRERLEEFAP